MMKSASEIVSISWVVLLKVAFDLFYILVINPLFEYEGYYFHLSATKLIESYLVLILVSSQLGSTLNAVDTSFHLFLSILFVPLSTYYAFNEVKPYYYYCQVVAFLLSILVSKTSIDSRTKTQRIVIQSLSENNLMSLMKLLVSQNLIYLLIKGGIRNFNLDLTKVYDYRTMIVEQLYIGPFAYTLDWTARIFNPMLFVYYYQKKNTKGLVITLGVQVLLFGFLSGRSILFYPLLLASVFIISKEMKTTHLLYVTQISILLFMIFLYLAAGNNITVILAESLLRRAYFVPARLNFIYYDFFSNNPKIRFSNVFGFRNIVEYPYTISTTSHLIGDYLGRPEMGANTGIFATGYMQFGILGLVIYSVLFGLMIKLAGMLERTKRNWIALSVLELNIITLISSDFPTSLLSHGLLVAFILYCISPDLAESSPL